jgi:hypothetical protein
VTALPLAGVRMGHRLTAPLDRGADVHELVLRPGAGGADVDAADLRRYLADHQARFDRRAQPAYVVRTLRDLDRTTRVTVTLDVPGGSVTAPVTLPAGTLAGHSAAVVLPSGVAPENAVPTAIVVDPPPPGGAVVAAWAMTALLGTTAKLLWAVGWGRDDVRRQAQRTAVQRRLDTAVRAGLDLIGADLGVPRFPPLPYGFDPATVALYHCDDSRGAVPAVVDFTGAFPGRTRHDGRFEGGAAAEAAGRFGRGIAMTDAPSAVRTDPDTALAVPADTGLTVECLVRPGVDTTTGRVLAAGAVAGGGAGGTGPGWTVELGDFGRGLPRAVRATIFDGTTRLELFGDVGLPVDRFTHVAAVVTRIPDGGVAFDLWLDGRHAAGTGAAPFGTPATPAELVLGPAGTGFRGVLDEVRISSVARTDFHPVLGEGDEHYRRRLRLFRGWVLPTPARLQALLNEIVGTIADMSDPLVVDDRDGELVRGSVIVRVVPAALPAGDSIDAAGRRGVTEADLYDPDADPFVDPVLLTRHDAAGVVYTPAGQRELLPGEAAADPHLVQPAVARALDALVALTAPAAAGPLTVDRAFDPRVPGPHATGRAVLLRHLGYPPARLAALAHRAGFDFVQHLFGGRAVYCSCAPGDLLALRSGADPVVGTAVDLRIEPVPPTDAEVSLRVVPLGAGRADLTPATGTGTVGTLTGAAPGRVAVTADVTVAGRTVTAVTSVVVRPAALADGEAIAADGRTGVAENVVGPPEPALDPSLLVHVTDPRITAGTPTDDRRRMQRGTARRLLALLDALGAGPPGHLTISSAFVPAAGPPTLASRGRALTIRHATVGPSALAVAAHTAGFGYVTRSGADVLVRHVAEPLIEVTGPAELEEGGVATYTVDPDPDALPAGYRLGWSSGALVDGAVDVSTSTLPAVDLTGRRAGRVWLQATLRDVDALTPFQVEVRLRDELVAAEAIVSRDQYELIMNVLHTLHPIGVEVVTRRLREAVVELRGAALDADPRYTYPQFQLRDERQ